MRELKFRAWWKDTKRFLDGDEWYMTCSGAKHLHYSVYPYNDDDFIIEQYTGLKDKNGKKIYEGDIMRFDAIDYEIYWSNIFSGWHNRRIDGGERLYGSNSFEEVTRFGKVIGNIHENLGLMEGKE